MMQERILNWTKPLTVLVAAGFLGSLALTATAQPGPGRGGMMDDQQRQLFREALQKDTDKLRELDEKLRAAQKELLQATIAEKYDENLVQTKAEAVAKIQVQITLIRSKALATVAPTLKPEQKEELTNSRFAMFMLVGGFEFGDRGGDRGGPPGGFRGGDRGGDRGGPPGGVRGGDRGGDRGGARGGPPGGTDQQRRDRPR